MSEKKRRTISITLEARDTNDSSGIIKDIIDCCPKEDDIKISIKCSKYISTRRDDVLEMQMHDDAKQLLDKNEDENLGKTRKVVEKEVAKKDATNWIKLLREEGFKIVLKEIYSSSTGPVKNIVTLLKNTFLET